MLSARSDENQRIERHGTFGIDYDGIQIDLTNRRLGKQQPAGARNDFGDRPDIKRAGAAEAAQERSLFEQMQLANYGIDCQVGWQQPDIVQDFRSDATEAR